MSLRYDVSNSYFVLHFVEWSEQKNRTSKITHTHTHTHKTISIPKARGEVFSAYTDHDEMLY